MKVGDYVRTKYGITQFKEYKTTNGEKLLCMPVKDGSQGIFANIEDVVKSSPNIIDLIEVGDYVNGHLVKNRRASCNENLCGHPKQVDIGENEDYIWISESKIKSIVTKEMFSSVEYRVEND